MEIIVIFIIAVVFYGILNLFSRKKSSLTPTKNDKPSFESVHAHKPYKLNPSLLTNRETDFYRVLEYALKDQPYVIAIKPRIADFVNVTYNQRNNQKEFRFYFNKISAKHVDFLLCDESFYPVLAIELDDSSHNRSNRKDRDDFVNYLYKTVDLKVLRIYQYSLESLKIQLSEMLSSFKHHTDAPIGGEQKEM
jgi:very-short-patch-repair endonuclease